MPKIRETFVKQTRSQKVIPDKKNKRLAVITFVFQIPPEIRCFRYVLGVPNTSAGVWKPRIRLSGYPEIPSTIEIKVRFHQEFLYHPKWGVSIVLKSRVDFQGYVGINNAIHFFSGSSLMLKFMLFNGNVAGFSL